MNTNISKINNGYIAVYLCIFMFTASSICQFMIHLYHQQIRHLTTSIHFTKAYAQALSGLRLIESYIHELPNSSILDPQLKDFDQGYTIDISPITFTIIKTPSSIYSYASSNDTHCILKATYLFVSENITLSNIHYHKSQ